MKILICDQLNEKVLDELKTLGECFDISLSDNKDDEINTKWVLVKNIRKVATGAIEKLREEIRRDMILLGCKSIKELNSSKIAYR